EWLRERGDRATGTAVLDQGTTEESGHRGVAVAVLRAESGARIPGREGIAQRTAVSRCRAAHRHRLAPQARRLPEGIGRRVAEGYRRHKGEGYRTLRIDCGERGARPDGHAKRRGGASCWPNQSVSGKFRP